MSKLHRPYLIRCEFKPEVERDEQSYPYNIPAVRDLPSLKFHPQVTFLIGENGSGKSTLLEALAMAMGFGPEGGTKNVRFSTADSVSSLFHSVRVARGRKPSDYYFYRAESFYNVATYMDNIEYLESYGGKSLHAMSHGESTMALLNNKFKGQGLYLLDEPEAALSPSRQLAALCSIHNLVKADSQFVIATHSPILLAYPNSRILKCDGSGLTEVLYEESDPYRVTRDFLSHYPRRLEMLFSES